MNHQTMIVESSSNAEKQQQEQLQQQQQGGLVLKLRRPRKTTTRRTRRRTALLFRLGRGGPFSSFPCFALYVITIVCSVLVFFHHHHLFSSVLLPTSPSYSRLLIQEEEAAAVDSKDLSGIVISTSDTATNTTATNSNSTIQQENGNTRPVIVIQDTSNTTTIKTTRDNLFMANATTNETIHKDYASNDTLTSSGGVALDHDASSISLTGGTTPGRTISVRSSSNNRILVHKNESIAACLLTMDDNHFLIEWLAYHYHVLPLRHLIVAVDPRAKTSSQEIFDRWNGLMNITIWNDTHIFGEDEDTTITQKGNKLLNLHRRRQLVLYEKCLRQFKSDGHQWVALVDTDEFMVVKANYHEDIRWPGSVLKYLKEQTDAPIHNNTSDDNKNNSTSSSNNNTKTRPSGERPPPCLPLPRRRYGTKESLKKFQDKHVPKGFNSSDFLTMRWRHYGAKDYDEVIKSMIDVSRVGWDELHTNPSKSYGVHIPLDICSDRVRMSLSESILLVSHYAGTWEQFSFRKDARQGSRANGMKNDKAYISLKRFQLLYDDLHRDWLIGFIKSVGTKEAHRLLKDVGKVMTTSTSVS
mmetsp:Transcript_2108/g.3861  ORF Transcript_2108/g.3861 Transcript_2108/m.3861 type:complete len:583 (+) Transcript_2108:65-1813(+)